MDSTPNKAGELERGLSSRNSVRISVMDADEDAELAAMGMVADGFRPVQSSAGPEPPSTPSLASASTTLLGDGSPESRSRIARPSSTSKPHRPQDSLSLRREGGMGQAQESTDLTRQISASTDSTAYLPAESPYQGPSGPSHPYQMYPQNVRIARTMSTATSSTAPLSESSYNGPRGPSHPYGLYPQSDGIETTAPQEPSIPLGFHGLPDQYRRQVGPDGEEVGDIIGPDGHTEQLPPYTRYPEDAYARKLATAEGSAPAEAIEERAVVADAVPAVAPSVAPPAGPPALTVPTSTPAGPTLTGAGGIGLATRNPEFDSTDDLGSPQSRHSSRSFTSDSTRQNAVKPYDEKKGKPFKPWQIWMRRKLWGIIPYWALCMTVVILLVMGAILGSVIGTFLAKEKKPRREKTWSPITSPIPPTPTFGAVPIPTPTDLPALPLGTYSMPLLIGRSPNTCFQDPTLAQAWNCYLVLRGLELTVSEYKGEHNFTLNCNQSLTVKNHVYSYGEQPPQILQPVALELVNDTFEPSRGPAWYKMLTYDKTVILPEGVLNSTTTSVSKRTVRNLASVSDLKRKGVAKRGDKPWVCKWPDTYLEMFIYPHQNTSKIGFPPGGIPGMKPSSEGQTSTSLFSSMATESPAPPPPSGLPPTPVENSFQTHPAEFGGPSQKPKGYWPQRRDNHGTATSSASASETATASSTSPWGPIDTGEMFAPMKPPYPRVIKLSERRVWTSGARVPECVQVEIQGYAQEATPVLDAAGKPVTIKILENEPPPSTGPPFMRPKPDPETRRSLGSESNAHLFGREGQPAADMSPCGCMWFLT
ncbi:hypothetical protein QBC35DRAFT_53522 [Podospora australis]|uniref:DUF7820 domain-containing protein n=1 Tax=Podospora australis TaxID=1536484 RepID=A0AAN6WYQ2_9PEZI|nr:hypothetical protein QBC35DRAFT_53522 [Podospora australis]